MNKKFLHAILFMVAILFAGLSFTSCSDDDDDSDLPSDAPTIVFENVTTVKDYVQSGTFSGITAGQSTSFTFYAAKGQALMFATMYGYSNDLFFAPENPGIALFNSDGTPVTGDVSSKMKLWDNGTRVNQQPSANVTHPGTAEDGVVKMIDTQDAQGNLYRPASELVKVNLSYNQSRSEFTITITNNSTTQGGINETPLSAGAWVVSNIVGDNLVNGKPFFTPDQKSSSQLTALAESGSNQELSTMTSEMTGIITGLSSAIVVIYTGDVNPIFEVGKKDAGLGLSSLAQKGDASQLKSSLERMSNVKHVYITADGSFGPTEKRDTKFAASQGDRIAYALMFEYSNDWFYANSTTIDALTKGDLTTKTLLYDNGTALNQYPGAGNLQHKFGGTSEPEDQVIKVVGTTEFPVPNVSNIIKVSIQ